jgi:small conductance mechanosensitive channel
MEKLNLNWLDHILHAVLAKAPDWGMRILGAVLVFFIGWWITKWINRAVKRYFDVKDFDQGLETFLASLISIMLKICLILTTASTLGLELTSFMAIFGSAGLAIGLALSGTLQNFAGGVIILALKPYKVGDVIEAQGYLGTVSEIQIFNTFLKTWDNKTVIIPNGGLSTGSLINYTTEETRVLEWIIGVSYTANIDQVRQIIEDTIFSDSRILNTKEEGYFINIGELTASSVNFKVRAKVLSSDYSQVFFDANEKIKKALDANGIAIPLPQRDIYLNNVK